MTFGERLIELRTKAELSQEQFAEIMNVSRQSISKWETDKAYPEMSRLIFMSDYFDVSLDYLVRGEKYESNSKSHEKKQKYQSEQLWMIWSTFYSNLSGMQKSMFCGIAVLTVIALICLIFVFCYGAGYAIGAFIGHITN